MGKNSPRFFCDNCGHEVGNDIKACPFCGRIFAKVRCPACSFSGEDKLFANGCPACGYSASSAGKSKPKPVSRSRPKKPKPPPAEPLHPGVYIISIASLLALVALLSYIITR
jgi:hypothetical protein